MAHRPNVRRDEGSKRQKHHRKASQASGAQQSRSIKKSADKPGVSRTSSRLSISKDLKDSKDPINVEVTTGTMREERESRTTGDRDLLQTTRRQSTISRGSSHKANLYSVIALFVAALALAGGVLLFGRWLTYEPIVGLCDTAGCERHVEELKAAMDTSVDPCTDFYSFTCGSWKPAGNEKSLLAHVFASSAAIAMEEMQGGSAGVCRSSSAHVLPELCRGPHRDRQRA
ncbi:hypothetical protein MTO96_021605 [Rhipicephalus appendiculatus]